MSRLVDSGWISAKHLPVRIGTGLFFPGFDMARFYAPKIQSTRSGCIKYGNGVRTRKFKASRSLSF
jgi:hypothetical protein